MGHHHHHPHAGHEVSRKLTAASAATFLFVLFELGIGILAGSLSLIGDAIHNFTDTIALLLALFAVRMERRPATISKSYGYQRAGVLAAFINAGVLVAFTIFLFVEAVERLEHPKPVATGWMLGAAGAATALNVLITLSLRREGQEDVNIRSATLHMLGDAISSAGIIGAALLIRATGNMYWDPLISIVIGVLILWSSWGILSETVNLLLEGTPAGIDPDAVSEALAALDGVYGVHHLHIWAIGASRSALSCHVMVGDVPLKTTGTLLERITHMLEERYRIVHATVQFEFANCAEDDPYCVPYSARSETSVRLE